MSLTKIRKSNIESNVKLPHANAAFDTANSSGVYANAAFAVANSAAAGSVDAYARDTSNSASSYANGAFTAANNAVDSYVRAAANAASSYANSAYTEANTRATISYVDNAVANLVNSAPATLDTLNELATALNNDPNFATTIATNIGIIGNYSNAAYVQANTANTTAQAAFNAANNAVDSYVRDAANSASSYANSGFGKANTANTLAQAAYDAANNAVDSYVRDAANSASSYANSSYVHANSVYDYANTLVSGGSFALSVIHNSFVASGSQNTFTLSTEPIDENYTLITLNGVVQHKSAYNIVSSNIVFSGIPVANTFIDVMIFTGANASYQEAYDHANGAFTAANNAVDSYVRDAANSASSYANSAYLQANTPSQVANAASVYANGAFTAANNAVDSYVRDAANAASSYANSAYLQANTPSQVANSASVYANSAYLQANTPSQVANSASSYANGAFTAANTAANSYALAQAAYDQANTGGGSSNSFYVNIVHDSFVASGSQNTFTLSTEPIDENYVLISFDGVVQHKSTYNVVSSNIEFTTIPDTNTEIDIVSYTRLGAGLFNLSIVLDTFTGDGTTNTFSLSTLPDDKNYTSIIIDGVAQLKTSYNISGSSLIFTESPDSGANIDVTIYTSAVTEENIRVDLAYNHANAAYEQANTVISLASRTSAASSTGNIADAATANVTVAGFKGYLLYKVQTSAAAWVRLYTSVAARTSDSARLENVDPLPGSGVIAEIISTTAETILITPGTIGFNDESSPNTDIALAVTNKSGNTANITVTLTIVQVES